MPYSIGIYGARNTCTLVRKAGLSSSSFVSDLSTGYSGNLGFPLPEDWAFDQVKEYRLYYSGGDFGIDKNVTSGRYMGFTPLPVSYTHLPISFILRIEIGGIYQIYVFNKSIKYIIFGIFIDVYKRQTLLIVMTAIWT